MPPNSQSKPWSEPTCDFNVKLTFHHFNLTSIDTTRTQFNLSPEKKRIIIANTLTQIHTRLNGFIYFLRLFLILCYEKLFCLLILKSQTDYNQNLTTHNVTNSNSHKKTKPMKLIWVLIKWLAQRKKQTHATINWIWAWNLFQVSMDTVSCVCFFLFLFMLSIVNNSSKPHTDTSYNNIIFIISFCFVLMN